MKSMPTPPPCRQCGALTSHREDDGAGITLTCSTCGSCTYYERDGITPSQPVPLPTKPTRNQASQPDQLQQEQPAASRTPAQAQDAPAQPGTGTQDQDPGESPDHQQERAGANHLSQSSRMSQRASDDWMPPYLREDPPRRKSAPPARSQQPGASAGAGQPPAGHREHQGTTPEDRPETTGPAQERTPAPGETHIRPGTPGPRQDQSEHPTGVPKDPAQESQTGNEPSQEEPDRSEPTREESPQRAPRSQTPPGQPDTTIHNSIPQEKQTDMTAPTAEQEHTHYQPALKARAMDLYFQNKSQPEIVEELLANHDAPEALQKSTVYSWIKSCTKLAVRELGQVGPAMTQGPWALTSMTITVIGDPFTVLVVTDRPTGYILAATACEGTPSPADYTNLSSATAKASATPPDQIITNLTSEEANPFRDALGPDIKLTPETQPNPHQPAWDQIQAIMETWVTRTKRKVTTQHIQNLLDGTRIHINIIQKDQQGDTPAQRARVTTHLNSWDSIAELTKTHTTTTQTSETDGPDHSGNGRRPGTPGARRTQDRQETQRSRRDKHQAAPTKTTIADLIQSMRQRCQELEDQRASILEQVATLEASIAIYEDWTDGQ